MWTATVQSITAEGGNAVAVVVFTDGEKSFTDKTFGDNLSLEGLQAWAAARIASLTSREESVSSLKTLVGQTLTPTVPEVDADLAAFRQNWSRLSTFRRLGSDVPELKAKEAAALKAVEAYLAEYPDAINEL